MKGRGVVADGDFTYNSAFDNPPIDDPAFAPEILWSAHCRAVARRGVKAYFVNEVLAFNGDDRKAYLANVGPSFVDLRYTPISMRMAWTLMAFTAT